MPLRSSPLRSLLAARLLSPVALVPSGLLGRVQVLGCPLPAAHAQLSGGRQQVNVEVRELCLLRGGSEGMMLCFGARCCCLEVALWG